LVYLIFVDVYITTMTVEYHIIVNFDMNTNFVPYFVIIYGF